MKMKKNAGSRIFILVLGYDSGGRVTQGTESHGRYHYSQNAPCCSYFALFPRALFFRKLYEHLLHQYPKVSTQYFQILRHWSTSLAFYLHPVTAVLYSLSFVSFSSSFSLQQASMVSNFVAFL
jgi:hypothetical protein